MEYLSDLWQFVKTQVSTMDLIDVIDIVSLTLVLFAVYSFIRDRRAGKLALGVAIVVGLQMLSSALGLNALQFVVGNIVQVGLIALIIVFQPELRSALEKLGGEPLKTIKSISEHKAQDNSEVVRQLCDAITELSDSRTGALIVMERSTKLGDVVMTGVTVNADVNAFLIRNIFFDKAPLHDGAMIIRDGPILAAGCFLPLSENDSIIQDLGTRHRAGIGMSENSDAIVIIVSEETGIISVAQDGRLRRNYSHASLRKLLEGDGGSSAPSTPFKRLWESKGQSSGERKQP